MPHTHEFCHSILTRVFQPAPYQNSPTPPTLYPLATEILDFRFSIFHPDPTDFSVSSICKKATAESWCFWVGKKGSTRRQGVSLAHFWRPSFRYFLLFFCNPPPTSATQSCVKSNANFLRPTKKIPNNITESGKKKKGVSKRSKK